MLRRQTFQVRLGCPLVVPGGERSGSRIRHDRPPRTRVLLATNPTRQKAYREGLLPLVWHCTADYAGQLSESPGPRRWVGAPDRGTTHAVVDACEAFDQRFRPVTIGPPIWVTFTTRGHPLEDIRAQSLQGNWLLSPRRLIGSSCKVGD